MNVLSELMKIHKSGDVSMNLQLVIPFDTIPGCASIRTLLEVWTHPVLQNKFKSIVRDVSIFMQPMKCVFTGPSGPIHGRKSVLIAHITNKGPHAEPIGIPWRWSIDVQVTRGLISVDFPAEHSFHVSDILSKVVLPGLLGWEGPTRSPGSGPGNPRYIIEGIFEAKALCSHWRSVFSRVPCDDPKLREWFDILFNKREDGSWNTGLATDDPQMWKILKKHISRAVRQAKNSMPGPDGIPASAYSALGDFAIDLLEDMIGVLCSEEAEDVLNDAYSSLTLQEVHAFNISILCCLPKKPSGVDSDYGDYYHPDPTRPLNISNVMWTTEFLPVLRGWLGNLFSKDGSLKCKEDF